MEDDLIRNINEKLAIKKSTTKRRKVTALTNLKKGILIKKYIVNKLELKP